MSGSLVSDALLRQIYRVVRRVLNESRTTVRSRRPAAVEQYHQGYLDAAIDAATNSKTTPATGTVTVWIHDTVLDQLVQATDASGNAIQLDVVNRTDISGESGAYCHVRMIGGEWQIVLLNCAAEA